MKILIVRLSSLGDILHTFPALSDLRRHFPAAEIHWLVEPAFAEMVGWHAAVNKVIPVPLRGHKKHWWRLPRLLRDLKRQLRAERYDLVLDMQGLLKSAMLARLAGVPIYGFDRQCAREALAAKFYQHTAKVAAGLHIIDKNRQLVAQLFDAAVTATSDYGLADFRQRQLAAPLSGTLIDRIGQPAVVLLHGTTWNSKYWPEASWLELVQLLTAQGVHCLLPWGNQAEQQRAERLQLAGDALAQLLPKLSLTELMTVLLHSNGFISVESGIGHLATVLGIPGIMLHGPTSPEYSGILDQSCVHLTSGLDCSPCFKRECPRLTAPGGIPPCQTALLPALVLQRYLSAVAHSPKNSPKNSTEQ